MLTFRAVSYREVSAKDLQKFFDDVYGFYPEIGAAEEWDNDTQHAYTVKGQLDDWELEEAARMMKGEHIGCGVCEYVLETLAIDGHIAKGEYLVDVCW